MLCVGRNHCTHQGKQMAKHTRCQGFVGPKCKRQRRRQRECPLLNRARGGQEAYDAYLRNLQHVHT